MTRFYHVDGELYPSVTTVLQVLNKPQLSRWRGKHGNAHADDLASDAAGLGTLIHKAVDGINAAVIAGGHVAGPVNIPMISGWWQGVSPLAEILGAYLRWLEREVALVRCSEFQVVSRRYRYAGTCDLVAYLHGDEVPSVIDVKTSNFIGEEFGLQLAAYRMALLEMGVTCERRLVVRLSKSKPGEVEMREYDDHERDERAFRNCLNIWRWREAQKPKAPRIRVRRRGEG